MPVKTFCVEHDRWSGGRAFSVANAKATRAVRIAGQHDDDQSGGGDIDEPFSPNDCECALCSAIGGIYDRWGAWEPANALEALLKRHIDGIGVDN